MKYQESHIIFKAPLPLAITFLCILLLGRCRKQDTEAGSAGVQQQDAAVATRWADFTLDVIKNSRYKSPTYASRSLAYMGICMYECVVKSDPTWSSLTGQLQGLQTLPVPEAGENYNWALVLNAGQQNLLKLLYPAMENLPDAEFMKIDALADSIYERQKIGLSDAVLQRSLALGQQLATALFQWSTTDGGFEGFKINFDPIFSFPSGPGYWSPPVKGQAQSHFPLHPHWGNNRAFLTSNALLPIPRPVPYSQDKASPYYKLYREVYNKSVVLSADEKEIAAWWADDPSQTFSPPGHSYNIATIVIKERQASLLEAAATYARVGLAVGEAFIHCWETKYSYFNERPSTYIRSSIDANWNPFWPEPPFPAYPSGHAMQAAATATVLTAVFGRNVSFTDDSHGGRASTEYKFTPRRFADFWAFAAECAYSRLLGGIHTQQDNDTGLAEGIKIGNHINELRWRR